jgi:CRISPR-associated protein Cas1
MRDLRELPKLRDGLSYLYLEHGRVEQKELAVEFVDEKGGATMVPAAALGVLLLGPGTTITHAAVKALADNGCLLLWTGEDATRLYAQGGGETRKAYRLLRQAELSCNPDQRLAVIRRMYEIRFQEPPDSILTLEQVRGLEGVRVRQAYARASQEYNVPWRGRHYDRGNWGRSDPVNRALSLGFIHTGKQLSFVYDIADLYKAEITIPLAFREAAEGPLQLEKRVRQACRQAFKEARLLDRILPDIDRILQIEDLPPDAGDDPDSDPAAPGPWWDPPEEGNVTGDE